MKHVPATKLEDTMRAACMALAKTLYAYWAVTRAVAREGRKEGYAMQDPVEPRLTVAFVRESLAQARIVGDVHVPQEFTHANAKQQAYMVRRALESLTREGQMAVSIGQGQHRNREVRCYNPVTP